MAEGKTNEQALVELVVGALGIIQKLTAASHHHKQATTRRVVVLVLDEVLRKVGDALGKHSNLETGGAGVLLVNLEVVDVDFAHCLVSLVSGLIFRGCGKSTLRGAGMIPPYSHYASQNSLILKILCIKCHLSHFIFDAAPPSLYTSKQKQLNNMEVDNSIWSWFLRVLDAMNLLPNFSTTLGIFCAIAWAGTLISVGMFIVSIFADMADGADAADAAGAVDGDAGVFSTRAIIAFILGFGWGGYLAVVNGAGAGLGIFVAVVVGMFMFFLVAGLMKFIYSLKSDGSLKYDTLVGMTGTVYVTIPPAGETGGQVQVSHPSQLITIAAVQEGSTPLSPQTRIEVTQASTYQVTVRPVSPAKSQQ